MAPLDFQPQTTPNPDAMKFLADKILNPGAAKAYYNADQAGDDPVARDLFAIDGVAGVMIVNDFCTVNKAEVADWSELIPRITSVLEAHWPGDS